MSGNRTVVHTSDAPAAVGPYSQAIVMGEMVFCSGQIGIDPAVGKLVEGDIQVQTRQVLTNLQAVLRAAGSDLSHVVKTTVFLTDMGSFKAMNDIYGGFFGEAPPGRSTVAVAALPLGALVEIEAIAFKK
jgi:2-iminobutanoate/2-iminopropanoate deaminase